MKKAMGIAVTAAFILALSGCANMETPQRNNESSAPQTAIQEMEESKSPEESSAASFSESKEDSDKSTAPIKTDTAQANVLPSDAVESSEAEMQAQPPADESRPPEPEAPKTPEPTPELPTTPPAEEPPKNEPPQETAPPIEEEPAAPEFHIQTWIDFAAGYAESVGLNLSPDAIACWDNPIVAGAHSTCLERDIKSRLNRYSRDEEITDVWIWAEKRSDESYDLYIGYA